ncbi:MAG: hypothetical protein K1W37_02300 [Lachnospiraceae bacterium]|jgi:hypothetical protein
MNVKWDLRQLFLDIDVWDREYDKVKSGLLKKQDLLRSIERLRVYIYLRSDIERDNLELIDRIKLLGDLEQSCFPKTEVNVNYVEETYSRKSQKMLEEVKSSNNHVDVTYKNINNIISLHKFENINNIHMNYLYALGNRAKELQHNYILFVTEYLRELGNRHSSSILDLKCDEYGINKSAVQTIFSETKRYKFIYTKFIEVEKRFFERKTITYSEFYFGPLTILNHKNVAYDEGIQYLMVSLNCLGKKYQKCIQQEISGGWIDVYPQKEKKGGSYCWGIPKLQPYIFLNYCNDLKSLLDLAHEMGHAVHAILANGNREEDAAFKYPIFLSEIVAIVNEILVQNFLIKDSKKNKETIIYMIGQMNFIMIKQVFGSLLEDMSISGIIQVGKADVGKGFNLLMKEFFDEKVESSSVVYTDWFRNLNIYRPYYNIQYPLAYLIAHQIVYMLNTKQLMPEQFIAVLEAGASKSQYELLKSINIDLNNIADYIQIFWDSYNQLVDDLLKEV